MLNSAEVHYYKLTYILFYKMHPKVHPPQVTLWAIAAFNQEKMSSGGVQLSLGIFSAESQHPHVGGLAMMASHCPSSPHPQLLCSLLLQSWMHSIGLPQT